MARYYNTEGCCKPCVHYMVRLDDRLKTIRKLFVDCGKYFVINRGRQYGKTTTLMALEEYLRKDYAVIALDFQMMGSVNFVNEQTFAIAFIEYLEDVFYTDVELMSGFEPKSFHYMVSLKDKERISMSEMFRCLSRICQTAKKPVVLIIDEADSASNNQVFVDFLAMLRGHYLVRDKRPIFHSVILAGVYDIKNLTLKIRPDEAHQYNSPWNISADFDVDMSFSIGQIAAMLEEYELDHHTGMNAETVSDEIYQYTSDYPYLVSALCKIMDEKLPYQKFFSGCRNI